MALVTFCLLATVGCRESQPPGETHDHEEEHAGHAIPAHKPKTFPDAVRRLRELNDQIPRKVVDEETLPVALDVATWLPEIAAESDMPETPWDEVNACSSTLVAVYQKVLSGAAASATVKDAGTAISRLETLLAGADPRWFRDPDKAKAEP